MQKFHFVKNPHHLHIWWWCPGCDEWHEVPVSTNPDPDGAWNWNGDRDSPTLKPSLSRGHQHPDGHRVTECHFFIRDGKIDFCSDSRHDLAGQKKVDVPLTERPVYIKDDPET